VRAVSALTGAGIEAIWDDVARFRSTLEGSGDWHRQRANQARAALWTELAGGLMTQFRDAPAVAAHLAGIEREVTTGARTAADGARELLKIFRHDV